MNAVDTNILVYACDHRDAVKQRVALELIAGLADAVIPWQVACEFIAASRKLGPHGLTTHGAWARLDEFGAIFPIVPPSPEAMPVARKLHTEHGVSFWDAMLLAACLDAGVTTLYSEDLPGGAVPGLRVVNPFAASA